DEDALCKPVVMIVVTDGQPDPWNKQGGAKLYERMRSIRRILSVKTYVVAYTSEVWSDAESWSRIHEIACSASGANSIPTPCDGDNDFGWDTCADKEDPANGCAWLANDKEELSATLTHIIAQAIETAVPGGAPTVANDFQVADPNDPESSQQALQTNISSWTDTPSWEGHVTRGACTDEDPDNPGQLADYCLNAANLPVETEELESFGPCPLQRVWNAGECLQQTAPGDRRLYTHGFDNQLIRITEGGEPSAGFSNLVMALNQQGKINPPLSNGDEDVEIKAMADFLTGVGLPDNWKLPGLSNSAPMLIRRVPQHDAKFLPSVGIRDPHCAGRRNVQGDNVPDTLQAFASQAWETTAGGGFATHYDYAEAVLIGDDFGILHAFHYDSGNELFGFVPLALINNARVLSLNGPENFGQPEALEDHVFGVASTVNAGWIFDEVAQQWRHIAVFGLGPGGSEILSLDVSHMARLQDDDPFDVLWTTTTSAITDQYAETLGETWSRPALTYAVPNDEMSLAPKAYLVFGSGYREDQGDARRGKVLWMVDATTGETVTAKALLPTPTAGTAYDEDGDVAVVTDIAIGSHCLSRYWGEMQEAYIADPAGRLFRWDLAADISNVTQFDHEADSGGTWPLNDGFAMASEAFRFPACRGTGAYSCSIGPIAANGNKG
ncbi:MAG: type IV pilin biogenesis protein, partial [Myxococcales bacterium]|nr:type IV pilin biogenesis protein [Myxococcales bacterium]